MASSGEFGQSTPVSSPNMFRHNMPAVEEMAEYLPTCIYHVSVNSGQASI